MRTLSHRKPSIPTLYVRSAPGTSYIAAVFSFARRMAPCMLVLEDIETIVNATTRSYFFNEVDGLENNDGILMLASTNFLDRLDPGLSKRPSRFDRKYLFPLPNEHERDLYAQFWRHKLKDKPNVHFPKSLCPAMAKITNKFSFAYIQEAFVATLLEIARRDTDNTEAWVDDDEDDEDDLDRYLLWRVFKEEVKILRKDMDAQNEEVVDPEEEPESRPILGGALKDLNLDDSTPALPGSFGGRGQHWMTRESFPSYPGHGTDVDIRRINFGQSGTDSSLAAWGYNDDIARLC